MINVLFMMKDNTYWKDLINSLILKNKNLRVCYIANTIKELTYALSNYKIDIVLMDVTESIYKKIMKNNLINENKYQNSVVLLSEQEKIDKEILKKECISGYVLKSKDIDNVTTSINLLINSKFLLEFVNTDINTEKRIKYQIKKELEYLGYNSLHFGTKYLIETIFILYSLDNYYDDNLEKDIYPLVAQKYGKKVHNIKCNIRNATDIMYYENSEDKIMKFLNKSEPVKPKTKEIISIILNKIKL